MNPWRIWGWPLYSNTFSYINNGFYRALKHMGHDVEWLDDTVESSVGPFEAGTVFLLEGQVDMHVPKRADCFYILHCCDKKKYLAAGIPESNILCYNVLDYRQGKPYGPGMVGEEVDGRWWNRFMSYDVPETLRLAVDNWTPGRNGEGNSLHFPWATDLLPSEIDFNIENLEKISAIPKSGVHFTGYNISIQCEYERLVRDHFGLPYTSLGGYEHRNVSLEENMYRTQTSLFAPAVQADYQQGCGYLPCRIFKNLSYGAFGVTNNPGVADFFKDYLGGAIVYDLDLVALTQKAIARAGARDFEGERKAMRFIRDEHTYINRVNALKAGFRHHWALLGLTPLLLQ